MLYERKGCDETCLEEDESDGNRVRKRGRMVRANSAKASKSSILVYGVGECGRDRFRLTVTVHTKATSHPILCESHSKKGEKKSPYGSGSSVLSEGHVFMPWRPSAPQGPARGIAVPLWESAR